MASKNHETIDNFKKHKVLYKLSKSRSPNSVMICTDDIPDEWLIDVVEYRTKSGVVTGLSTIIAKDLQRKIDWYVDNGWTILTKN